MAIFVHHGDKDGDVRKGELEAAMRAAVASLRSTDYATRRTATPPRRIGGASDRGTGYVHETPGTIIEVFNRGEWPGGPVMEIGIRHGDADRVILRMGHPTHVVTRSDRRRLANHIAILADAVASATPWDSTPAASGRVRRFDALCELAAIQASKEATVAPAPVVPIDCPGVMETPRQDFARRRDGMRLVVGSAFRASCVRRVGCVLVLKRRMEGDDPVHTLLPMRTYVTAGPRDALETLRAIEALPLPDGTGPLVEWRMPDQWGRVI